MAMRAVFYSMSMFGLAWLSLAMPALADPPGRVGRLSYMEGSVLTRDSDAPYWARATLNMPVTNGDGFWTAPGARSEIEVGPVEIRMDGGADLEVIRMDDDGTQVSLPQGTINIHVHGPVPGGVQVATTSGTVDLQQPGSYHIDAGYPEDNGAPVQAQVAVLDGQAAIDQPGARTMVQAGETALLDGNPPSISLVEAAATPFDDWALARDRERGMGSAATFVSQDMTGYQDLDRYGEWQTDSAYGPVWYPRLIVSDWAPYRYGHWAYVRPWGWTWVDDAPWGFAPFHYGRWARIRHRWGWVPGPETRHPVYAPALVTFVGGGTRVTIAQGIPQDAVGWVPLGPSEVFRPYYKASERYVYKINTNKGIRSDLQPDRHDWRGRFANRDGVTVVPSGAFVRGEHAQKTALPVKISDMETAPSAPTDINALKPMDKPHDGERPHRERARPVLPGPSSGQSAIPRPPVTSPAESRPITSPSAQDPDAVRAYWTPERMRNAQPVQPQVKAPQAAISPPVKLEPPEPKASTSTPVIVVKPQTASQTAHPHQDEPLQATPQGWVRGKDKLQSRHDAVKDKIERGQKTFAAPPPADQGVQDDKGR